MNQLMFNEQMHSQHNDQRSFYVIFICHNSVMTVLLVLPYTEKY